MPLLVNTNLKECPELLKSRRCLKDCQSNLYKQLHSVLSLKGDWRDFRQEEVTLAAGNFNLNVHGNQSSYEGW